MKVASIDFVIPWVNGSDLQWQQEFNKYNPNNKLLNTKNRFNDWDNLQYIFRAFENFTPWVNKIYFITYGHLPKWLNTQHPKLVIVKHEDYIDNQYLPVFSSHPIEINMHRIKGLSEKFVFFNDDFFILKPIEENTFFVDNLPVDFSILNLIDDSSISHILMNDVDIINKNFNRHIGDNLTSREHILKHFKKWFNLKNRFFIFQTLYLMRWKRFTGFVNYHFPQAFLKSTFETLWEKESEKLNQTTASKFRDNQDVNQYLFRYWQLVTGNFKPIDIKHIMRTRKQTEVRTLQDIKKVVTDIKSQQYTMYCINDGTSKGRYTKEDISKEDFELSKELIKEALNTILPNKSSFEL